MGIWRSIFGWEALFRWDALGAVVPGMFLAVGFGMLGIDWFPHHLLISQICLGIATVLCTVKIVRHAYESEESLRSRLFFGILLSTVAASLGFWMLVAIQKHKTDLVKVETPLQPTAPSADPIIINQTATGSDCSNILAKEAKLKCEVERDKEHGKTKP